MILNSAGNSFNCIHSCQKERGGHLISDSWLVVARTSGKLPLCHRSLLILWFDTSADTYREPKISESQHPKLIIIVFWFSLWGLWGLAPNKHTLSLLKIQCCNPLVDMPFGGLLLGESRSKYILESLLIISIQKLPSGRYFSVLGAILMVNNKRVSSLYQIRDPVTGTRGVTEIRHYCI